ncbi:unnamed protein product [Dibothriocephalus latus]|uniref:Uncharacterized protein n=1 Tax=Dibothriocephalus latus TaxID=60516 RepID=A0A3P6TUA8_DIBLA|nr:unnamed protein product [Dibothriocephalus latus]
MTDEDIKEVQQCGEMMTILKLRLIRRHMVTLKCEILAKGGNQVSRELLESWFMGPQSINKYKDLPNQ